MGTAVTAGTWHGSVGLGTAWDGTEKGWHAVGLEREVAWGWHGHAGGVDVEREMARAQRRVARGVAWGQHGHGDGSRKDGRGGHGLKDSTGWGTGLALGWDATEMGLEIEVAVGWCGDDVGMETAWT